MRTGKAAADIFAPTEAPDPGHDETVHAAGESGAAAPNGGAGRRLTVASAPRATLPARFPLAPLTEPAGWVPLAVVTVLIWLGLGLRGVIGFAVAAGWGTYVIWQFVYARLGHDGAAAEGMDTLSAYTGVVERLTYTAALVAGGWIWIAAWLAIKIAVRWPQLQASAPARSLFLLENALSVGFALLGAVIVG